MEYTAKSYTVDAILFDGDNVFECIEFTDGAAFYTCRRLKYILLPVADTKLIIRLNNYIIRNEFGEYGTMNADQFEKRFERERSKCEC